MKENSDFLFILEGILNYLFNQKKFMIDIHMSVLSRENADVKIGDEVKIYKIQLPLSEAKQITLKSCSPLNFEFDTLFINYVKHTIGNKNLFFNKIRKSNIRKIKNQKKKKKSKKKKK